MEKKIHELGLKTGLTAGELKKITRFGVLGLAALALASLSGCFKSGGPAAEPARPAAREQPEELPGPAASVNTSTAAAAPDDSVPAGKNCGPYPGYPCGTRYFTVSPADFQV